ncbi:MAG: TonB-dependent receptor plug domain-containing protein, partial [Sphingopyxis sp.]
MTNFDRVVGLMGASVVAIACASPAMAQTRTYSIPAQSAAGGVAALARQSDQQVLISARDAKGKKTREVRGEMTIEQAFAKLLAGSGLTAKRTGAGAWAVVQGGNGGGARLQQAEKVVPSAQPPQAVATSTASGAVVDARTGAALKGAIVELIGTGQRASTGDLGEFRFPGKTGKFNVWVSYLGYPPLEHSVELVNGVPVGRIVLSDGGENGEIVVYGSRSARAQALNQERTSENSRTVVSADLLGRFDGTTISESLRRQPGVAFQPNPQTGDGANIIVRGLSPEFNTVTVNGLRLAVGNGTDRSPSLNNILTESISKVTINKTLLPSQDGSGTGGLVEIETKGPLDQSRRHLSLSVDRAMSGMNFVGEFNVSGTASAKFGAQENFGLSASVQYRKRNVRRIEYRIIERVAGQYLPLAEDGTPIFSPYSIDPRKKFPFEDGVDELYPVGVYNNYNSADISDLSIGLSGQWKIGKHTDLRLDFTRAEQRRDTFNRTATFGQLVDYTPMSIDELGGEVRGALVWQDLLAPDLAGGLVYSQQSYSLERDQKDRTQTVGLRGLTELGHFKFDYTAGFARASASNPNSLLLGLSPVDYFIPVDPALIAPEALNNTRNGRIVSIYAPRSGSAYPLPMLNQVGFDYFNDSALYYANSATLYGRSTGGNDR